MLYILCFALGYFSAAYIFSILDAAGSWVLGQIEVQKAKQSEKINLTNIKMRQDAEASECAPIHAIGFQYADDTIIEEDEEE